MKDSILYKEFKTDRSTIFDSNSYERYRPESFELVNIFIKNYDEFIFNQTPCSRCPKSHRKVVTKVYKFKSNKELQFYSVGLREEVPNYLYRTLSEASLMWNLRVKDYISKIYDKEFFKINGLLVLSSVLLFGFSDRLGLLLYIFYFFVMFFIIVTLGSNRFAKFYMELLSRKDSRKPLSFLEKIFVKISNIFIRRSSEEFSNSSKENNLSDINFIYLEDYRSFRLNIVSLKFNLKQISNKEFVFKAREGLELAVELVKYLELHKDKIVYSRDFFKTTEKILKLTKVLLDNQEFSSEKSKEIDLKSIELIKELVRILSYSFSVILDYDKDELLAKLDVMKMDSRDYLSYLELKGDKFSDE